MKKTKAAHIENKKLMTVICFLIMLVGSVLLPVLLKLHTEVQYKSIYSGFTAGDISEKTIYAKTSIDLIDYDKTQQARANAKRSVLPVFSYSNSKTYAVISKADSIRTAVSENDKQYIEQFLSENVVSRIMSISNKQIFSVAYDLITEVLNLGFYSADDIASVINDGYATITLSNIYFDDQDSFEQNISLSDNLILTSNTIRSYLQEKLKGFGTRYTAVDGILIEDIILSILEPNIIYDPILTAQRRDQAEKATDPVVISVDRGQILIQADHVVTNEQMALLNMLSTQSNNFSLIEMFGHIVFDCMVLGIGMYTFYYTLGKLRDPHYKEHLTLLVVSYLISLLATYFFTLLSSRLDLEFVDSFLPVFFLPLFMSEITGYKRIGFISATMLAAVMSTLPTSSSMTFFYCVVCGCSSVFFIRFFNRRIDVVYQWFFSAITCTGVTILFIFVNQSTLSKIFTVLLGTLINVSIAHILLTVLMPIAEKIFNLPTVFRLYELAYGESPLLSRLSQAAPGTYNHSMAVADLSAIGAKAINANPLLARVGAMYHDIGKIEHPEYFVENQSTGVNKHDDISPSLSVAVIKSHVKVGAEKGREAGLPIEIIKIIASHHGNDVISYFYNEALKFQAASPDDKGETVKASDYSYNAEIPDFKECGIVMLADSIEAASRTVANPSVTKYAKLIDSIFMGKIERGQLDNSGLTMNDIRTLADTFVKALVARNHSRIEYPEED